VRAAPTSFSGYRGGSGGSDGPMGWQGGGGVTLTVGSRRAADKAGGGRF
jgi:hypothetical protein